MCLISSCPPMPYHLIRTYMSSTATMYIYICIILYKPIITISLFDTIYQGTFRSTLATEPLDQCPRLYQEDNNSSDILHILIRNEGHLVTPRYIDVLCPKLSIVFFGVASTLSSIVFPWATTLLLLSLLLSQEVDEFIERDRPFAALPFSWLSTLSTGWFLSHVFIIESPSEPPPPSPPP